MFDVRLLGPDDEARMRSMLTLFGRAFDEPDTYVARQPSSTYLRSLLADRSFLAVAAIAHGQVVGGAAAYILTKFEQERQELYLYDLAVDEPHRRQGIATALIDRLRGLAAERGISTMFVQADRADLPAIALYSTFADRHEVVHFEIAPTLASPRKAS